MTRRQRAILAWFGLYAGTAGSLTWWLGAPGATLLPGISAVLIIAGVTPERVVNLARKVGAIRWWEDP